MLTALLLTAAAMGCEEPVDVGQLGRIVDMAETAWVVMDRASFEQATLQRRELLACLDEPLGPDLAIRLHLHEALAWSLERRTDLSQAAFRAILTLHPDWELPLDVAPEQHRLRQEFAQLRRQELGDPRQPFFNPGGEGALMVDGVEADSVPSDRPFVVQVLDDTGAVAHSHYFTPGSDAGVGPSWLVSGYAPAESRVLGDGLVERQRTGAVLMGGGVGLGLLAGGLYALASSRAADLENGELGCGELEPRRTQVNQLVASSVGVGALGLGLGVAGVGVRF